MFRILVVDDNPNIWISPPVCCDAPATVWTTPAMAPKA